MVATANNQEPDQRRGVGKVRPRVTASIAVTFGALNVALSVVSVLFAALNDYPLRGFLDYLGSAVLAVSFSALGMLVASRRPGNPLGWIYLTLGLSAGLVNFASPYAEYALVTDTGSSLPAGPLMSWLGAWAWIPAAGLLITFALLLFPDGKLPSPRWRPVAWLSGLLLLIVVPDAIWLWPHRGRAFLEHPNRFEPNGLLGALLALMVPLLLACGMACLASLGVRFWRSRGTERQQIKWLAYAAAVTLTFFVATEFYSAPIVDLLALLAALSMPTAVGIAVLKHRLYDIDLLINRTLVYGALTVTLAGVYFGGVAGSQAIFGAMTGQDDLPQLATVLSTLLIAALFMPLRYRIQSTIDRRFYRRRYDARKTLEAFSTKLRDETDLEALNADLVGVVAETMQPAHVSMWLSPDPAAYKKSGSTAGATRGG
jgi:hypothetical protein